MTSGRVGQATWRISSRTSRRNWLGFVRWLRRRWTSATDVERRETGAPSAPTCPCRCIMRFCSRFISRLSSLRSCDPSSYEQGRRDSNPQPPVLETGALPIEPLPFAHSHRHGVDGRRERESYHPRVTDPLAGLLVQRVLALPL